MRAIGSSDRLTDRSSEADVLVPDLTVRRDVAGQEVDALGVVEQDDPTPVLGHPVVTADEVVGFADHDAADAELAQKPAAVPARRERRHHHAILVVAPTARGTESGRLGVHGRIPVLDPTVVAATEQRAVLVKEGGTDADAALLPAVTRLLQSDVEHLADQRFAEPPSRPHMLQADSCPRPRIVPTRPRWEARRSSSPSSRSTT